MVTDLLAVAAGVSDLAGSMYLILLDSACAPFTISIVSSDFCFSARCSTFLLLKHIVATVIIFHPLLRWISAMQQICQSQ